MPCSQRRIGDHPAGSRAVLPGPDRGGSALSARSRADQVVRSPGAGAREPADGPLLAARARPIGDAVRRGDETGGAGLAAVRCLVGVLVLVWVLPRGVELPGANPEDAGRGG